MSLHKKIEKLQSLSNKEIGSSRDAEGVPYLKYVFEVYTKHFGQVCQSCASKLPGYIKQIRNIKTEDMKTVKSNSKYIVRPGKFFKHKGKSYSEHNVTDEVAAEFLAVNENRKQFFLKSPNASDENLDVVGDRKKELESLTRPELNTIGDNLELDSDSYSNKGELADAIIKAETIDTGNEE